MIEALVGNATAEKVLLFLTNYGEGHASGIARTFGLSKSQVRKQLLRFETGGIIVGRQMGNQRIFSFNPRCPYRLELLTLVNRILALQTDEEKQSYYRQRRRPRRTGKK